MKSLLFVSVILLLRCYAESAKILIVIPMPSRSHYNLGSSMAFGLAEAGHHATLMSPLASKKIPTFSSNGTFKEIVLKQVREVMEKDDDMNMFDMMDINVMLIMPFMAKMSVEISENLLADPETQALLKSDEKFDVVIVEEFLNPVHKLFASHFNASLIAFSSMGATSWVNKLVGNPAPPSYIPDLFLDYSTDMTFFERLHNSLFILEHNLLFHWYLLPKNKALAKTHFPGAPDLEEVVYNPSLVLLNSHESTNIPVPKVPKMVNIGGYHIKPPKELPQDLKKFIDEAEHGVIYFSMGSNLKSSDMSAEKKKAIINSFSKLKQRVLWKFEEDLPDLPPKVMIRDWFPQSDILAHKNVKLFITHGGLLSTTETVYHGVPILAIPVFGDQQLNAQNAINGGFGLLLTYPELTEEGLTNKLNELLNNSKYSANALLRSKLFHDRIVPPMKAMVYWVEYVIRNPNTAHLRVAGVDLPWYKYLLLDVLAFVTTIILATSYVFIFITKKLLCKRKKSETKVKQN